MKAFDPRTQLVGALALAWFVIRLWFRPKSTLEAGSPIKNAVMQD